MVEKMEVVHQKLFEVARAENQKLQAAILSKIEKELKTKFGKLQEIHESVSKRITDDQKRVSHLEKVVDMKMHVLEKTVFEKLVMMEEKMNNFQSQQLEPV